MKTINKSLLLRALLRLGVLAEENGVMLEICLYGGALMMLAYDARKMTKDVDAIVRPAKEGFAMAEQVGRELGLPDQWINDQVKLFIAPSEQVREIPWEGPGIKLTAPTAGYLLAMKALACRDPLPGYEGDLDDLRFLIRKMGVQSVDDLQAHIGKYYPDDVMRPDHEALLRELIAEVRRT